MNSKDGIKRGPFGSSLKKSFFVKKSDYVVYEQQNAIYDQFSTRYFINEVKYNELEAFSLKPNDFILSGSGTIGCISLVPDNIKKGVINQALIRIRINQNITNKFFFLQWMRSSYMQRRLTQANPGSAITNLVPISEIKNWKVTVPNNKIQKHIGKILTQLDTLLSLQQRKLELENELNRFYIGKIFANNNNYPELRFSSFNNSWEIAKLKEIITHKSGSPIEKYFSENGPLKVISIGSYGLDNSYIDQKIRAERNNVTEKYMVQKNDLTMVLNDKTSDCRILGRVLIINNDNEYVANQRTEIITPNKTVYPQFLYQLINGAFRTKIKKIAQGGTQIYVNFKSVEKLKLSIPEYEEQKDISKFLGLIKNKLSFEQSNVTITQQLKQFLLQNLFI
ncbi:restriction endonuclease subunit S [Lactobacillus mulieris]|uniref:restriction endonuclease subunit S n=1 Tax=Lactobacillus mulieris TaxID=2508708 RepID=UPI0022ABCA65|nr:restriction endonuclease subunit S [Lactobacillus mulieris]MCZ3744338.1 restriction endonuclease subunit S [Lactobacillus mulieris]MDT9629059.1 restriction endonuclease subunit S [Lactobacillus mulieris]